MENENIGSNVQGILKFNLDDFAARREFEIAVNGHKYKRILEEVVQKLRDKLKYGHHFKDADTGLEWIRAFIYEECEEQGVQLE